MAADLVNAATSEKLAEVDWIKNIEICEIVSRDQRLMKGKACATEGEDASSKRIHMGLVGLSIAGERANRLIIRPIFDCSAPELDARSPPVTLPPPPAKHVEREKFFQDKKVDGPAVGGHSRGPSVHSYNTSRSGSVSLEFSE